MNELQIFNNGEFEVRTLEEKRKYAAQERYDANNTTRFYLKLNNNTDSDIIAKLNSVPSKQGYIKECIRQAMKEEMLTKGADVL